MSRENKLYQVSTVVMFIGNKLCWDVLMIRLLKPVACSTDCEVELGGVLAFSNAVYSRVQYDIITRGTASKPLMRFMKFELIKC